MAGTATVAVQSSIAAVICLNIACVSQLVENTGCARSAYFVKPNQPLSFSPCFFIAWRSWS